MSDVLRVMIVDDERPAREGLRLRLKRERDVIVIGEFPGVTSAVDAMQADAPDLVFVDIEMPDADGFALVTALAGAALPLVVFATAHDQHAVRAFGVQAFDYLLKPIDAERLAATLARARTHLATLRRGDLADRVHDLLAVAMSEGPASVPASPSTRIPVRVDGTIRFINTADVDFIDAAGDSIRLHTGREVTSTRMSMGDVLAMLDPRQFVRIHRSTIVNRHRIRELQPWFHGEYMVVLDTGAKLKLSRTYRAAFDTLVGSRSWLGTRT